MTEAKQTNNDDRKIEFFTKDNGLFPMTDEQVRIARLPKAKTDFIEKFKAFFMRKNK